MSVKRLPFKADKIAFLARFFLKTLLAAFLIYPPISPAFSISFVRQLLFGWPILPKDIVSVFVKFQPPL